MLSYRHSYHAGVHADVLKHVALVLLIQALKRKPNPLFYLDTHAGAGVYSLESPEAQKVGEYKTGILPFWDNPERLGRVGLPYLELLRKLNPDGVLRYYPGSPWIAAQLLSQEDRLAFCELHPSDYLLLEQVFSKQKNVRVYHGNGLHQLKALLPPPERRGLIFIDPSYEVKSDYDLVPEAVWEGYKRFATGVFCIWYPMLKSGLYQRLLGHFEKGPVHRYYRIERVVDRQSQEGMYGSGLYIINPPWQVGQQLKDLINKIDQ